MSRRFTIFICSVALMVGIAGTVKADPVPFQITGGSLVVHWNPPGGGIVTYTPVDSSFKLDQGQSENVTFGMIGIPLAAGSGTADFEVDFSMPTPDGPVFDTGQFRIISFLFFSAGSLTFGDPVQFGYSYGDATGGVMTLDFNNISGIQAGTQVAITGTITNTTSPTAVPEPSCLLLLAIGALGAFACCLWK